MLSCRRIIRPKMATTDSLTEEFECPVCNEVFKQPKVVGPCLHTLCRDCVQKYVTARGRPDAFPCPVCRKNCVIPNYGVDGLKDNFHLSSIIEQYYRRERNNLLVTDVRCIVCKEKAKTLCKTCESIHLCSTCTERHNHDPKTRGHEIIGLCSEHDDKPMSLYCKDCRCAICPACQVSEHSSYAHDVSPRKKVLDKALLEKAAATSELENAVTRVNEKKRELSELSKAVQMKESVKEELVTAIANRDITEKETKMKSIEKERFTVQRSIETLLEKKSNLNHGYEQCVEDLRRIQQGRDGEIAEIRKPAGKIKQCLRSLDSREAAMRAKLQNLRVAETRNSDAYSIEGLLTISKDLHDLASESKDPESVTLIEDVKKTFNIGSIEPCLSEGVGTLRNPKGSLKSLKSASFPFCQPCHQVLRMRVLRDGRVAILGRSSKYSPSRVLQRFIPHMFPIPTVVKLYIYDTERRTTRVTAFDVKRASDIAVTSAGEIIVVHQTISYGISLLNLETGQTRFITISTNFWVNLTDCAYSVETDEVDNMFVQIEDGVVVFTPQGNFIVDTYIMPESHGGCKRMSYCKRTGILYIAADDKILRYLWNGRVIKKLPKLKLTHGVAGFHCTDIAVRNRGVVLVTGKMERDIGFMFGPEIRVYEVAHAQHIEDTMERIHFHCKRRSHWLYEWDPNICRSIHDNQLWLGCGSSVELCETITVGKDSIMAHKESFKNALKYYLPFKDSIGWKFITCQFICLIALCIWTLKLFNVREDFCRHRYHHHYDYIVCKFPFFAERMVVVSGWAILAIITLKLLFNGDTYDHLPRTFMGLSVLKQIAIVIFIMAGMFIMASFIVLLMDLSHNYSRL